MNVYLIRVTTNDLLAWSIHHKANHNRSTILLAIARISLWLLLQIKFSLLKVLMPKFLSKYMVHIFLEIYIVSMTLLTFSFRNLLQLTIIQWKKPVPFCLEVVVQKLLRYSRCLLAVIQCNMLLPLNIMRFVTKREFPRRFILVTTKPSCNHLQIIYGQPLCGCLL